VGRPFIIGNSFKITTMAFSQLFRDLKVRNYDNETGEPILDIPVHVSLDTKEALYEYLKYGGDHKKIDQKDTMLPRIGIQISSIAPAVERETGKNMPRTLLREIVDEPDGSKRIAQIRKDIQPVPFNITYTVSIWCKYIDHWAQLQENILPHFNPYVNVGVKERGLGIERQIRVRLDSVSPNNSFEVGNQSGQRIIRSEMEFTCETVLYKFLNDDVEASGIIENIWLWMVDIETPFASTTINISGAPTESPDITGTESPGITG
jgi:hypothetical protein